MSKRKLLELVEGKLVAGWDDPRMPTLAGLRRRGFTPEAIRDFCERIGVAKTNSTVDVALLEHCHARGPEPRGAARAGRAAAAQAGDRELPRGRRSRSSTRRSTRTTCRRRARAKLPFSRVALHRARRLRSRTRRRASTASRPGARCGCATPTSCAATSVVKDAARRGRRAALHLRPRDPRRRGARTAARCRAPSTGSRPRTRVPVEVRLYDRLFRVERPDLGGGGLRGDAQPGLARDADREPHRAGAALGRWASACSSSGRATSSATRSTRSPDRLVFNRIVPLRDSWAQGGQEAGRPAPPPAAARGAQPQSRAPARTVEPLSAEEAGAARRGAAGAPAARRAGPRRASGRGRALPGRQDGPLRLLRGPGPEGERRLGRATPGEPLCCTRAWERSPRPRHDHRAPRPGPRPLRALADRLPARRRRAHRDLQRPAAPEPGRRLHPAHRGHRPRALGRGHDPPDPGRRWPGSASSGTRGRSSRASGCRATASAAEELLAAGKAYRCFCTPDELDAQRAEAREERARPSATRAPAWRCSPAEVERPARGGRALRRALPHAGRAHPLPRPRARRHGVPAGGARRLHPPALGRHADLPHVGGGRRHRHGGSPTCIRGEDHLSNTPKHIPLFQALGGAVPIFGHLPLILGPDKKRLSKRYRRDLGRGVPRTRASCRRRSTTSWPCSAGRPATTASS